MMVNVSDFSDDMHSAHRLMYASSQLFEVAQIIESADDIDFAIHSIVRRAQSLEQSAKELIEKRMSEFKK